MADGFCFQKLIEKEHKIWKIFQNKIFVLNTSTMNFYLHGKFEVRQNIQ